MGDMDYHEAAETFVRSVDLKPDEKVAGMIRWAEANGKDVNRAITIYGEVRKQLRPDMIKGGFAA